MRDKKGFTLIELLAVIVVLALVAVLATTTLLPYMRKARTRAFAIEAQEAINAAVNLTNLIELGEISKNEVSYKQYENGYCYNLTNLIDAGLYKKSNNKYDAKIDVTKKGNEFVYQITMTNGEFYIYNSSNPKSIDVQEISIDNTVSMSLMCATE